MGNLSLLPEKISLELGIWSLEFGHLLRSESVPVF